MSLLLLPLLAPPATSATLPASLEWKRIGASDIRQGVWHLLRNSYVAADDDTLRLDYSPSTLSWMMHPPGAREDLRVAIAASDTGMLVGFICAVPSAICLNGERCDDAVEVSLLCIRQDWRRKGLATILLRELRRRAEGARVQCAIYTASRPRLHAPMARADCYHRPLRPLELLKNGFWQVDEEQIETLLSQQQRPQQEELRAALSAAARLPDAPHSGKWRRMRRADAEACRELLDKRAAAFALAPSFPTIEAFEHRFLGHGSHSFVLLPPHRRGGRGGRSRPPQQPLGFVSFSLLPLRAPSSGARIVQAQLLGFAAASTAATDSAHGEDRADILPELLAGALREAHRMGVHVFNANRMAELTARLLEGLGFRQGDAATFICVDGDGGGRRAWLEAAEVAWLPVL